MTEAITSVLVASASAVAKVFVIGAIGFVSAIRPKAAPILPASAMNAISKMNFNLLIIPLVYSALASGVTPAALGSLWIVLVSGIGVITLSYWVATVLGKLPFFRVDDRTDFDALRVAAAFPNIVALPILIFPTLCEFPVVYNAFYEGEIGSTDAEKYKSCVDESNAMIFVYFFAWNLLYWIIGYPTLVAAGKKRQMKNDANTLSVTEPHNPPLDATFFKDEAPEDNQERQSNNSTISSLPEDADENDVERNKPEEDAQNETEAKRRFKGLITLFTNAIMQTLKSPGFVAMVLGVITACIPPLRDALFSTGGSLRFLGSALESLGSAGASVGTLVVAASLVHQTNAGENASTLAQGADTEVGRLNVSISNNEHSTSMDSATSLRESMRRRRSSISQLSIRAMNAIKKRQPTLRMHFWFCFSRLFVTPAIVCLLIIAGECGGILNGVPNLAKLVVIVNACLPGAQLIVLTLKARGLSDSASVVAQVYLPSYLFSVVTIAAWTSLGLIISTPHEDGSSFCSR
ncbi:hypothetical protein ACHAXM_009115 [Skeletonema potamos]